MIINNNIPALNTHRQMGINQNAMQSSMEKLSSGLRINRAGDDAAGLAISEKMRAQINGLDQASRNAQDGISLIQTAEGALDETHSILQRMRELAVQSANDTNVDVDREELQKEVNQLSQELTRISETTEFNTQTLLDGSLNNKFHIGANQGQNIGLSINDMSAEALEVVADTISINSSGSSIRGVEADLGFKIEDFTLSAELGGATGANLVSDTEGVQTVKIAPSSSGTYDVNFAVGVTNNGQVSFDGEDKITLSSGGDINWGSIDLTTTATMTISATSTAGGSAESLSIVIDVTSNGGTQYEINDTIQPNSSGGFDYNNHGVSFTVSEDEVSDLVANSVSINFQDVDSTSNDENLLGSFAVSNSWEKNLDASGNPLTSSGDVATIATGISFDPTTSAWIEGVSYVEINGNGLQASGGVFEVVLKTAGGTAVSTDQYTFPTAATTFDYDAHGVSFTINFQNADEIELNADLRVEATGVNFESTQNLDLRVTDENGVERTILVEFNSGNMSLDQVAAMINDAADAVTGASWGSTNAAVAVVSNGAIRLQAANQGSNANVRIESDIAVQGASDFFGFDVTEQSGSDSSIDFTLSDGDTSYSAVNGSVNPSATSVRFEDSNGNRVTFQLNARDNLDNVDVERAYAASGFEREISGIDISTNEAADAAITTINNAIETVSAERSKLGAIQNRLEHTISNLDNISENLSAAESRIRDVDMAQEMMEMTRANILSQASQSMLAQANQQPQSVLQLLG